MADQYVDKVYIEAEGAILECASCEDKTDTKAEAVPTMNPEGRAKGYRKGVPEFSITVEVPLLVDGLPWSPRNLYPFAGDPFSVVVVKQDARRTRYSDCSVKSLGEKGQVNGNATQNVEITALRCDEE